MYLGHVMLTVELLFDWSSSGNENIVLRRCSLTSDSCIMYWDMVVLFVFPPMVTGDENPKYENVTRHGAHAPRTLEKFDFMK